jgi:MSHA biogenesis protein MshI
MKRTVNLYHASLKPQKEALSLARVAGVNGAVLAILVGVMIGFSLYEASQEETLGSLRAEITSKQDAVSTLTAQLAAKRDTASLAQRLASTEEELANKQALVSYLNQGELSFDATRYGQLMDDLATYHNDELWLTHIAVTNDDIRLSGETLAPSSIPNWLKSLQRASFFKGKTFSIVQLDEVKEGNAVRQFTISSRAKGESNE